MVEEITPQQYEQVYNKVYAYFFRRVSNKTDVEDLTCATTADYFLYDKPVANGYALLWTIARNKLYRFIHKKSLLPFVGWDDSVENLPDLSTYSNHYKQQVEEVINVAKKQLKPTDFDVVELCVLCDFNSNRAAKELGLTSTNVRQKLSRSLKKLRDYYENIWHNKENNNEI